jgi:hypothetical protein
MWIDLEVSVAVLSVALIGLHGPRLRVHQEGGRTQVLHINNPLLRRFLLKENGFPDKAIEHTRRGQLQQKTGWHTQKVTKRRTIVLWSLIGFPLQHIFPHIFSHYRKN